MDKKISKYLIAILPNEEISNYLSEIKQELAIEFNIKQALNAPPHITLQMPFYWKDNKISMLENTVQDFTNGQNQFEVKLHNFGKFQSLTYFAMVQKAASISFFQQALSKRLKRQLGLMHTNYKNRSFEPHITLAYRDVKKSMVPSLDTFLLERKYETQFLVKEISMLKLSPKRKWEVVNQFEMKKGGN